MAERPYQSCASSQGTRHDGRHPGSFLHPLSLRRGFTLPRGRTVGRSWQSDEPGSGILKNARGGSYRSAWNRRGGVRRRQRVSEDGTISVKAPPAVATVDQARGVRIQGAVRRRRVASSGAVPVFPTWESWGEGASGSDRPKRAPANSSVSPSQVQAARTALVRGGLPPRTKVRGGKTRARARTAKSVFSRRG